MTTHEYNQPISHAKQQLRTKLQIIEKQTRLKHVKERFLNQRLLTPRQSPARSRLSEWQAATHGSQFRRSGPCSRSRRRRCSHAVYTHHHSHRSPHRCHSGQEDVASSSDHLSTTTSCYTSDRQHRHHVYVVTWYARTTTHTRRLIYLSDQQDEIWYKATLLWITQSYLPHAANVHPHLAQLFLSTNDSHSYPPLLQIFHRLSHLLSLCNFLIRRYQSSISIVLHLHPLILNHFLSSSMTSVLFSPSLQPHLMN